MTGKDLFVALGDISQKYYDEAENDTAVRRFKSIRRPLLIAAAIAMALLLVGCGIVYALRLQDMSIGQETYTQSFDEKGKAIEPVEKTRDIITIYGHSGDAIQLALKEWYEFLETYDPDGALMDNNPDHPEIPNQYEYTYSCYTQEMVDKVNEIAGKYNLKLLDTWIPFQQYQSDIFLEETGIHSLLLPDTGAQTRHMAGMLYPPYNFNMEFELIPESGSTGLWTTCVYARKDYFPRDFPGGMDLSQYAQWDHTAPDGTRLLLALSSKGHGYVIAEPDNAMLILSIDGNRSNSAYPDASQVMTKDELEAVADLFDYSILPKEVDRAAVEAKLAEAEAAYQAENAYEPETYGSFKDFIISHYLMPNAVQYTFYDLTGDGEDELLLGYDGAFTRWLTMQDGEVVEQVYGSDSYLCEGRILESYSKPDEYWDIERHIYNAAVSDTAIVEVYKDGNKRPEMVAYIGRDGNQWYQYGDIYKLEKSEISQEEAAAIMAKYPRIELDWKPLMDYPLDENGQTLGSYLEKKDVRVSDDELLRLYTECLNKRNSEYDTHYRILDINGDGVKDLLLSGNGETYWEVLTYRYGSLMLVANAHDFYLCEGNVLERDDLHQSQGVEMDGKKFFRYDGLEQETLDLVVYNKATASWQSDYYGTTITEADAQAIIAKYPRIDQGMRPISELLNG